ncbi:MAG: hypothetical protein KF788_16750 [Piscinibacter sp.]|nr:hypothetical protein [Piscinibacter sp.]
MNDRSLATSQTQTDSALSGLSLRHEVRAVHVSFAPPTTLMLRPPKIHQVLRKPNRLRTHFQMPKLGALDIELPDGAPDASVEADVADVLTSTVARAVLLALICNRRATSSRCLTRLI